MNAYRHGWGCPTSTAHLNQSVCPLLFPALESRRAPGSHPRRQRVSYHHGNLKRRWWWCPRLSWSSPARCTARPQSAAASHFAKRQRLAEWHRGSPLHPLLVSRSLCCRDMRYRNVFLDFTNTKGIWKHLTQLDDFLLSSAPVSLKSAFLLQLSGRANLL